VTHCSTTLRTGKGAWSLSVLLALLAGACSYDPKVRSGVIACTPDGPRCPGRLRCVGLAGSAGYACQSGGGLVSDAAVESIDAAPRAPDAARPADAPADGNDDAPVADAEPDASAPDSAPDSGADVAADAADAGPPCPDTGRGPRMVRAGGYCIDATEVTNRQYLAFVTAKGTDLAGQPTGCAKNAAYVPETNQPPWPAPAERADHPVVNVDWCDAHAFCEWAGKRLCGKIGGGGLARTAAVDPATSQWASACSRTGSLKFPYGPTFKQGACNVQMLAPPAGSAAAAGTTAGCQGGYDGLYDMVGNVEEWVDACGQDATMADTCALMGGSFAPAADQPSCADGSAQDRRLSVFSARGFRCCSKE
jgi:formylglycine-generating enzyme